MLYTRKGDDGTSGLFGARERLPKDDLIYEALGTVDETISHIGLCRASTPQDTGEVDVRALLLHAEECLFTIQAEIAGAPKTLSSREVPLLEGVLEQVEAAFPDPKAFVIPGATVLSAHFDVARTVARRAERCVVRIKHNHRISASSLAYLNRLSSLLYALARYTVHHEGKSEVSPHYH